MGLLIRYDVKRATEPKRIANGYKLILHSLHKLDNDTKPEAVSKDVFNIFKGSHVAYSVNHMTTLKANFDAPSTKKQIKAYLAKLHTAEEWRRIMWDYADCFNITPRSVRDYEGRRNSKKKKKNQRAKSKRRKPRNDKKKLGLEHWRMSKQARNSRNALSLIIQGGKKFDRKHHGDAYFVGASVDKFDLHHIDKHGGMDSIYVHQPYIIPNQSKRDKSCQKYIVTFSLNKHVVTFTDKGVIYHMYKRVFGDIGVWPPRWRKVFTKTYHMDKLSSIKGRTTEYLMACFERYNKLGIPR